MLVTPTPIELLAPVGSPDALIAAVRCGADAVYLGAGRFHARQHSTPFDDTALEDAVRYCHQRGVQVHLTLNTLVREDEFRDAVQTAERAAALGIDALIVQDRGLAAAVHRAAPSLTLHASTQLTCHTPAGVDLLRDAGFSRVVLAREMSADEIAACCHRGCEIETFVHGALCMSVSGQCLLSAFLGGRSGNRGHCAQPCRLPFRLQESRDCEERALSLRDLSLFDRVQELKTLGVRSLKIEGRMKRPEYVAAAVSVCRAAIDGTPVDETLVSDLQSVFSRSGFTDGYYTARRTVDMFGHRTKEDVTAAPAAQKRLAALYRRERAAVPLAMTLTLREDAPLTLTAADRDGHATSAAGERPRQSDNPLSDERLTAALRKLGDTPFFAEDITVDRDVTADVPLSAVNALRREVTASLLEARAACAPVPFAYTSPASVPATTPAMPALCLRLSDAAKADPTVLSRCALTAVPLSTAPARLKELAAYGRIAVEIPRGMFGQEEAIQNALVTAKASGACAAVCHTVGALPLAAKAGLPAVGGFGLHTFNAETLAVHHADGLQAATLSPELSAAQMRFAAQSPLPVGAMLYGRVPLMLLRNCPAKARIGCRHCDKGSVLTDRMGARFPLQCEGGCADLLNSVPLYLGDRVDRLPPLAFWWLYMTDESPTQITRLTEAFDRARHGQPVPAADLLAGGFTRGRLEKGVD
ncbi:MAG: U32 family peptidase [Clostridia bacterium]|nr:U32 family peptidase [Clostridia bacterium]